MAFVTPSNLPIVSDSTLQCTCRKNKMLTGGGMFGAEGVSVRFYPTKNNQGTRRVRASPITCSDMGISFPAKKYDDNLRIGVISTRWNGPLVSVLADDVKSALRENGVTGSDIVEMQVPGSFELPLAARFMGIAQKVDAVVCLGVLIKGDSEHYEYIASAVSKGIMDVQLSLGIPIVFGVLCCQTQELAEERSKGDKSQAKNWAKTALEMANLRKSQVGGVSAGKKSVGFF